MASWYHRSLGDYYDPHGSRQDVRKAFLSSPHHFRVFYLTRTIPDMRNGFICIRIGTHNSSASVPALELPKQAFFRV